MDHLNIILLRSASGFTLIDTQIFMYNILSIPPVLLKYFFSSLIFCQLIMSFEAQWNVLEPTKISDSNNSPHTIIKLIFATKMKIKVNLMARYTNY